MISPPAPDTDEIMALAVRFKHAKGLTEDNATYDALRAAVEKVCAENKWFREAINVRDAEDQRTIDVLKIDHAAQCRRATEAEQRAERAERERDRYKEVLHYLRDQLLHSEKGSWLGSLWLAIDKALFPSEGTK